MIYKWLVNHGRAGEKIVTQLLNMNLTKEKARPNDERASVDEVEKFTMRRSFVVHLYAVVGVDGPNQVLLKPNPVFGDAEV